MTDQPASYGPLRTLALLSRLSALAAALYRSGLHPFSSIGITILAAPLVAAASLPPAQSSRDE